MRRTFNQQVVKKENKAIVLKTIKEKAPLSRADTANVTGLNKGTVSSLVSELLDESIIYESGPGKSSGGRRPVLLHFNEKAGYSIGIDLGVNYLLGILTDLDGNIVNETKLDLHKLGYGYVEQQLFKMVDTLIASAPKSPYGIIGIGIGVPGVVNKDGEILLAPNLNWKRIQLKEAIENRYLIPVIIENEANGGAYGEKKFGVGQNFRNLIYISVGIGIGVGILLDGKLYQGNHGFSGELGHMTINVNGQKCSCGNNGCWELYASEQAMLRNAQQLDNILPNSQKLDLATLNRLAEKDEEVVQLFEQIGDYLGIGINNIIRAFNPEQVIIGNRIVSSQKWIKPALEKRIRHYSFDFHQQDLDIDFSTLSTHSTALGVAAFTIEKFLKADLDNGVEAIQKV